MTRLDVRMLIFLYVAILMMLGILGFSAMMLVAEKDTPSVGVEDTARAN